MRILASLALCVTASPAQSPEDAVRAVYRQMEHAEQTGDAKAWIALWSRDSEGNAEKMAQRLHPRPDAHYTASTVFVQGNQAALLGQAVGLSFLSMRFVQEDGRWKIRDQVWNDRAADPNSVYAMIPAPDGAFARAGSPWQNTTPGLNQADAARRGWQLRAVRDESFLYIRIESATPLPTPGSTAEKPPGGWPVLKVAVPGQPDFTVNTTVNIGDQATFDESGRANSHRPFVSYSMRVEQGDHKIFEAEAGLHTDPLVHVSGQNYDLRIPLRTLGITDASRTSIVVGDASWPKSAIVSVQAAAYR